MITESRMPITVPYRTVQYGCQEIAQVPELLHLSEPGDFNEQQMMTEQVP
jgi:hypothetical protein